jgi:hypothetical protein
LNNLILSALATVARQNQATFAKKTRRIEAVQEGFLRSLLSTHQNTAFGQEYGFADIRTIDQFRRQVPIQPYAGFDPYIQRMANGEPNVLVSDPLIYFNISSGSTGRQKLIPVTRRSRSFLSRASRTAMGFLVRASLRENRPLGKMLYPVSTRSHGQTPSGIPFAPVSTSDVRLMDVFSRQVFTYPFEACQISDTTARYYVCLLFALRNRNLRIIGATFPVLALQMCTFLDNHAESLIHDIQTGEIAPWLKLDSSLRSTLERKWDSDPQRAEELWQAFKANQKLTPKLAWQNLSFMVTARGGTSNFYFERFPEYFGDVPVFGGTYACAEGVLGVHRDFNTDSVIPAIDSVFLELIPENQWNASNPTTILPWEAKVGDRYRIVFTNVGGFYRYDLGDVVEIDGFYEKAPLILFRHRQGGVMSSSTEKTTEAHVIEVMGRLQQQFGISLENFCITLSKDAFPAHYLVNIELAQGSDLDDPELFLQQFDEVMKDVQEAYALKRKDQVPLPRLRILAPGSFESLRQHMIQSGVAEAQLKFPHVSEDRDWLTQLTVLQEVRLEGDRP